MGECWDRSMNFHWCVSVGEAREREGGSTPSIQTLHFTRDSPKYRTVIKLRSIRNSYRTRVRTLSMTVSRVTHRRSQLYGSRFCVEPNTVQQFIAN